MISRKSSLRHLAISIFLAALNFIPVTQIMAETVVISASKDATIFSENTGGSNGAGNLYAGKIQQTGVRRALLAFDISGNIPSGATIQSVTLALEMSMTTSGSSNFNLHKLSRDWGESSSPGSGGQAGSGSTGDATWSHAKLNQQAWTTSGGDFNASSSASRSVGGIGSYTWSSSQMSADVQGWLDSPSSNFGWLLKASSESSKNAKEFQSRSSGSSGPKLTVVYEAAAQPVDPVITWANPADITVGTALSGTQLNASASFDSSPVAGTFVYSPSSGTVLNVGNNQILSVTFTPNDTANFNVVQAQVTITVLPLSNRQEWLDMYFSESEQNNAAISGDGVDLSGDGLPNLLVYAFDRNPRADNGDALPVPTIQTDQSTNYLTIVFVRDPDADDLTYRVEVSGDLTNWTVVYQSTGGNAGTGAGLVSETGTSLRTVTVRDTVSADGGAPRFIRLIVEREDI